MTSERIICSEAALGGLPALSSRSSVFMSCSCFGAFWASTDAWAAIMRSMLAMFSAVAVGAAAVCEVGRLGGMRESKRTVRP